MELINSIGRAIVAYVPRVLGAIAILVIGWLIAYIIFSLLRSGLIKLGTNKRLVEWTGGEKEKSPMDIASGIAKIIYYLILLFVLVAFFQTLKITVVSEPINQVLTQVFIYIPQIIGALILLFIAWLAASILRLIILRILTATKIDERLCGKAGIEGEKRSCLTKPISEAVYWLVFLLFIPLVLNALNMQGLLVPIQGMINKILNFLPNLITAGLILAIGWFVARIVQRVVTNMLAAIGVDRLSERPGLAKIFGKRQLSVILGVITYILLLIPIIIASLNTLQLEAVTSPASNMLNMVLKALPNIFAAALVLIISLIIGQMLASLISNFLTDVGFDNILARLGLAKSPVTKGEITPSSIIGYLIWIGIMLFAIIEASNLLGFMTVNALVSQFIVFIGRIILGLIIFSIGLYLASFVHKSIKSSGIARADTLGIIARIAIIIFVAAMALRQMGLANEIINTAFALILGAIAVAVAIAFGVGGRDIASRELDKWINSMRSSQQKPKKMQ